LALVDKVLRMFILAFETPIDDARKYFIDHA
jgi:hypothetical protein